MYKVGDKFIIEIGGEYNENHFVSKENLQVPTTLYKIKDFNSLFFDESRLDKLEKYDENNIRKYATVGAYFLDFLEKPLDFVDSKEKVEEILSDVKDINYEKSLSDAWECMKKLRDKDVEELKEIFGLPCIKNVIDVLNHLTPQEAINKLKEWEEKHEIKVGDVVRVDGLIGDFVVTWRKEKMAHCMSLSTGFFYVRNHEKFAKTGRHIDLTEIFNTLEAI